MKSILGASVPIAGNTLAPSATVFWPPSQGAVTDVFTSESVASFRVNFDCTMSKLRIYSGVNSLSTSTTTITLRKNGADTAITFTIPPGGTGWYQDLVNTVSFSPTDSYTVKVSTAAGGTGTIKFDSLTMVCDSDDSDDYSQVFGAGGTGALSLNATTIFSLMCGNFATAAAISESNRRQKIMKAATLSHFQVNIVGNARITNTVFRLRKNGGNANQILTIGAGLTGIFIDTTSTDSVAVDDDIGYSLVTSTGGGQISWRGVGVNNISQDGFSLYNAIASTGAVRAASASATYYPLIGTLFTAFTTESRSQTPVDFDATLSNLMLRVAANTYSGTATVRLRINGVDGNQTFSIGAGATGLFEDTVNTDTIQAGDLVTLSIVGGTSGNLTFTWAALFGTDETPEPPVGGIERKIALLGRPQVLGGADLQLVLSPPAVN